MKKTTQSALFFLAALLAGIGSGKAQTLTGNVVTQPCNNNGVIAVTATGLTPPISYTFTNWITNQTVVHPNINSVNDNLTGISAYQFPWGNANIWQVTASDGTNNAATSVTLTAPFSYADSVFVANCPASSTVQASFSGGTAPYSCVWTNQNTAQTYNTNPAAVSNGMYGLVVTDANGCVVSSAPSPTAGIYVYSNSGILLTFNGTAANCTNGTANVTASGGTPPYTYLWSNGATTANLTGLSQGMLSCTVTDGIGCQKTSNYFVPQAVSINFNTTITNATCLQSNGSLLSFVSGGTAPYTYLWSNGATTQNLTGLQGNQNYQVVITDANGCTRNASAYVSATTPISVTYVTNASSCTSPTGGATLTATGGLAPYSIIWYTFPVNATGTSITNRPAGNYSFKVTDANGCIRTGVAVIPSASTLTVSLTNAAVTCPVNTGNLSVSASGSNPPFTYAWSTGGTGSSITGVPLGSYNCTVTDAAGCSQIKYGYLSQISPINVGLSPTAASCIYSANGSLAASPTGGTAPYTYLWNNAQTGSTATGLLTGNYSVIVTDANGCTKFKQGFVGYNAANNSCYCTITGTVYADANSNCVQNGGENGIPNIQVYCSGLGYAYTNANGVYSFMAPSGTYTVAESVQQMYPLALCQANNQTVTVTAAANCTATINFANNVIPVSDLRIFNTHSIPPIPGNTYTQKTIITNDGSVIENNIRLGYTHDGQLGFSSCTPWALTQPNAGSFPNWYRINSGFPTLNPGANSFALINYNVPSNIPLFTQVNFYDTTAASAPIGTSWLTDNTPWNNVSNHQPVVVGSYDPNFKEVSPQGSGPQGYISVNDSVLTYVIHFQNTGSYFAQNIVVIDSLDSDLKVSSLKPGYADHLPYTTTISDNGVAKFTFANIHLPWKANYGDVLSSGMFSYSIKLKNNLPLGTQIKNKAAIYFDFNEPIITNTTLNTLAASPVALKELRANPEQVHLFPNPASNYFTLAFMSPKAGSGVLRVFDISGREVSVRSVEIQAGENTINEATSHLQNGVYLVQLTTADLQVGKKLIIAK